MRIWKGKSNDDGSIHCLGNGKLCAYEQGPDIVQLFGPPYSSPSAAEIRLDYCEGMEVWSERVSNTAIWKHVILQDDEEIAIIEDFTDANLPCFVRRILADKPVNIQISFHKDAKLVQNAGRFATCFPNAAVLSTIPSGTGFYGAYPVVKPVYHQFAFIGASVLLKEKEDGVYQLYCGKGETQLLVTGGQGYGSCVTDMEAAIESGFKKLYARTAAHWKTFLSESCVSGRITALDGAEYKRLLQAADGVAVMIKTQQDESGGILAGHNYHLAYMRDQYGVSRCLLKLGLYKEARSILSFYWSIWCKFGKLFNAQAMGIEGTFHVHENDEVEITGYLIIQGFDYHGKTGDDTFIEEILPMLEWAWECQKKHLAGYMLPFNGDETYVAGGVLPRNTLNDGSAEATLIFITGGRQLLDWVEKKDKWECCNLNVNRKLLDDVKEHYRENFYHNSILITNNPARKKEFKLPAFRHGVCEGCGTFGWSERNVHGRYVCPECLVSKDIAGVEDHTYILQSVSLIPVYIGSDMFSKDEILMMVEGIILSYKRTGRFPSRPDSTMTVGYDYGLLLYNLIELEHPLAREVYTLMMSVLDQAGVWVEYYEDGKPQNTRCRPWESGINLEAALHFAEKIGF